MIRRVLTAGEAEEFVHKKSESMWYAFRDHVITPALQRGASIVLVDGVNQTAVVVEAPTELQSYSIRCGTMRA